ncbi:TPA: hypothetical protein I7764_21715 [Vibrio vulnificus]|nr:hypothetical protein [Vibrio vulnificus]
MTVFFFFFGCILPGLVLSVWVKKNSQKANPNRWLDLFIGLALIIIASVMCKFLLEQIAIGRYFDTFALQNPQYKLPLEDLLLIVVPLVVGGIGVNLVSSWLKTP